MSNLEKLFLGTFISSQIFLLLALICLFLWIVHNKQLKNSKKKKSKNKVKRKKQKKLIEVLNKKKKKEMTMFLIFMFLLISCGLGAFYTSYYQSIKLSPEDSDHVIKGYYLLSDFEKQLESIKKGEIDKDKSIENIQNLGGKMASYSELKANSLNKEEGQVKINRYYNVVKEIGTNAIPQSQDFYENKELVDEFLNDIKKVKGYQTDIFNYYKINKDTLKKNE